MIVSNALPIQFWPADQDTYNESEVCGVETFCFCQPVQCDDTIYVQVTAEDEDLTDFGIAFIDSEGVIVYSSFFGAGPTVTFSIVPQIFGICDDEYQVVIYDSTGVETLPQAQDWVDTGLVPFIIASAGIFTAQHSNPSDNSIAETPFSAPQNTEYVIRIGVTISGATGAFSTIAAIQPVGGDILNDPSEYTFTANGTYSVDLRIKVFLNPQTTMTAIISTSTITGDPITVTITFTPETPIYLDDSSITYKSDCLDIRTSQPCTELVTYSNHKNFAGLVYEGITPTPEFSIRLPVVFFHESYPQEEEVHPLSNDTWIRLSSRIERKKLFDLGYMPYYMHQKTQLVLMHDNIEIQGEQWKKRDSYNIEEGSKRYPKPKANVLLTDKNFIKRNVI